MILASVEQTAPLSIDIKMTRPVTSVCEEEVAELPLIPQENVHDFSDHALLVLR